MATENNSVGSQEESVEVVEEDAPSRFNPIVFLKGKNKKKLEEMWNAIRSGRYGMKQLQRDLTEISKAMKIYY
jgi:hypothetical protein